MKRCVFLLLFLFGCDGMLFLGSDGQAELKMTIDSETGLLVQVVSNKTSQDMMFDLPLPGSLQVRMKDSQGFSLARGEPFSFSRITEIVPAGGYLILKGLTLEDYGYDHDNLSLGIYCLEVIYHNQQLNKGAWHGFIQGESKFMLSSEIERPFIVHPCIFYRILRRDGETVECKIFGKEGWHSMML